MTLVEIGTIGCFVVSKDGTPLGDAAMSTQRSLLLGLGFLASIAAATQVPAACCYFSAKNADILQPAQKAFLTWDPAEKMETFTVQPKFEGNALDFGMVIPTPTQPKLHEMPRDFFKHLAVYSIMKHRESPHSKLLPLPDPTKSVTYALARPALLGAAGKDTREERKPAIKILEAGVVGS